MPKEYPFQTILDFLGCLGSTVERQGTRVSAKLHVAGEVISTHFYHQQQTDPAALRGALKQIEGQRKADPGANYWLITDSVVGTESKAWITATGIRAATVHEYLNAAFKSVEVCRRLVGEADSYIPESLYVEQKVEGSELTAPAYVNRWFNEGESNLLVVLAQAGHGKTCLSYNIGRSLAAAHVQDPSCPIPFYTPLHRHRHVREFEELVLTNLEDWRILGLTSKAFAFLVNVGKVVPILDGFDELAETGGIHTARRTLAGLLRELRTGARAVLTSRHAFFRHRADISLGVPSTDGEQSFQTAALEAFGADERQLFWQKLGVPADRIEHMESMTAQLGADEEFLGSPLMLSIFADATEGGDFSDLEMGPRFLHGCFIRICEREAKRQPTLLSPARQIDAMSTLADLMLESNSYVLEDGESWLRDIVRMDIPVGLTDEQQEEALDARVRQLKDHAFLRILNGSRKDALSFLHPLYRDYLLALKISDSAKNSEAILPYLRKSLPDVTVRFLPQIVDLPSIAKTCLGNPNLRSEQKNFFRLVLRACDLASSVDRDSRTEALNRSLGGITDLKYVDLSALTIRLLTLDGFDLSGSDLRDTALQNCRLLNCNFDGALLNGARLFDCTADAATAHRLTSFGVENVKVETPTSGEQTLLSNQDPIRFLLGKFFRRFIRRQRGMHQRTAQLQSFVAGLGDEERRFTQREILPLMKKLGVIEFEMVKGSARVACFNPDWQSDGDALVWDGIISERLRPITDDLRGAAEKYTLT